MKSKVFITIAMLLFAGFQIRSRDNTTPGNQQVPLQVHTSQELSTLSNTLISDYLSSFPDGKVSNKALPLSAIDRTGRYLEIVSDSDIAAMTDKPGWKMVIGRDIVVPVRPSNADEVFLSGNRLISYLQPAVTDKSAAINVSHIFYVDQPDIRSAVEDYFKQTGYTGSFHPVHNMDEILSGIKQNPASIGFCNINSVIDQKQHEFMEGIALVPIDKNMNGQLDYHESIYANLQSFTRGVWIGKYPQQLVHHIYVVAQAKPTDAVTIGFLKWIVTSGQEQMGNHGFSELVFSERPSKLDQLSTPLFVEESVPQNYALVRIVFIIFAGLAILGFILNLVLSRKYKKESTDHPSGDELKTIDANELDVPKGLYFDKTHTWVYMEKDGIVKIGIDDFLQHITGPYTKIMLKDPGEKVKKHEQIMTLVQDGKQLNIYAPVSGTIREINEILVTDPDTINTSPYADGWVYMLEPSNWLREIQFLRMADKYREWIQYEFTRLKDFLAGAVQGNPSPAVQVAYQEGGALKDHVLHDQSPRVWEDFQKKFVDVSGLY